MPRRRAARDGSTRTGQAPSARTNRTNARVLIRDAVRMWLADGKRQGWSARCLEDRRQSLERFCWWLEHEERTSPTLDALTRATVRSFLA